MEFLISYKILMGGSLTAMASGLTGCLTTLWAAAEPQINDLTSSIGAGSVLVGSAGVLTAIGALLDKYWKDRSDARQSEERKLRIASQVSRNNWITRELYDWVVELQKAHPEFPKPPNWVKLHDHHEEDPHV